MSEIHLSLLLSAVGAVLGLMSVLLTILFALLGPLAALIIAAFCFGVILTAPASIFIYKRWTEHR